MNLLRRIKALFTAKSDQKMAKIESKNAGALMELNYQQQRKNLSKLRQGLQMVNTERVGLERRVAEYRAEITKRETQIENALKTGRRDLAREALERKNQAVTAISDLEVRIGALATRRDELGAIARELETRLETTRERNRDLLARKAAAEAITASQDLWTGVSDSVHDATLQLGRIEEEVRHLENKAESTSDLVQLGLLDDAAGGDRIDRELERATGDSEIDAELDAIAERLQIEPAKETEPAVTGEGS